MKKTLFLLHRGKTTNKISKDNLLSVKTLQNRDSNTQVKILIQVLHSVTSSQIPVISQT